MADDEINFGGAGDWLPDEALANLAMERTIHPEESPEGIARRIFEENAPSSALAITHMAIHSTNERVRLDAAKYVTERVLGRAGDNGEAGAMALDKMIAEFVAPIEDYANKGNKK